MVELFNWFRLQMALMCNTELYMDQPELTAPALKDLCSALAEIKKEKK